MDVGVIGIGNMGRNHVRVYSKIRKVNDIFIYDSTKKNFDDLKDYGVIVCNSLDEILSKVDAVNICVPTELHFKIAQEVISKNINCFIEKPITSTVEEGQRLIDTINDNLTVGIGHIERFNPIIDEIKKVTNDIRYCEIKRHNPASSRITDSNVVKDLMIHDIDIIFNVLFKNKKYSLHSIGNEDICSSHIKFNDSVISISASRIASKKIRSIYVEEKDFTIEGDFMLQELYIYRKPEKYGVTNERYMQENIIEKVLLNREEPLYIELDTFIKCVKNKKKFPVTPEQALNNLIICDEVEKGF